MATAVKNGSAGENAVQMGHDRAHADFPVKIWTAAGQNNLDEKIDSVAEEIPVALVFNDISHAVMMVSPSELDFFAIGFSLTEGIIKQPDDIYDLQVSTGDAGIEVKITLSNQCFTQLKDRRRSMSGRTGCGVCGAESLEQIRLPVPSVKSDSIVSHDALQKATMSLADFQPLQAVTGAVHGAAWFDPKGKMLQICEDVGRHNALDKLIGCLSKEKLLGEPGFLLLSSRASYEMVQKAAMAGIAIVVAVSAPTTMAIDIAQKASISLVGFSRDGRHVVYSNHQRLI